MLVPFFHVTQECLCVHTCACIMFVLLVKTRPAVVFCIFSLAAYLYQQRYFAECWMQNTEWLWKFASIGLGLGIRRSAKYPGCRICCKLKLMLVFFKVCSVYLSTRSKTCNNCIAKCKSGLQLKKLDKHLYIHWREIYPLLAGYCSLLKTRNFTNLCDFHRPRISNKLL